MSVYKTGSLPVRFSNHPTRFSDRRGMGNDVYRLVEQYLTTPDLSNLSLVNNCRFTRADGAEKLKREMEARSSATFEEIRAYEKLAGKPFKSDKITHFQGNYNRLFVNRRDFEIQEFEKVRVCLPNLTSVDVGLNLGPNHSQGVNEDSAFFRLLRQYPKLEKLILSGWYLDAKDLNSQLLSFPRLHTLDISGFNSRIIETLENTNSQIRNLNISGSTINDDELQALVGQCPNLESLNISHCRDLTPNGLKLIGKLTKLRHLYAAKTRMDFSAFQEIATFCPLETLDVSGCQSKDFRASTVTRCIERLTKLRSLAMSGYEFSTDILQLMKKSLNTTLRVLDITDCRFTYRKDLPDHLNDLLPESLEHLEITGTDIMLPTPHTILLLPNLRVLKLQGWMRDDHIQTFLERCPELTTLEIDNTNSDLQGDFLIHLARCPHLEHLEIKGGIFSHGLRPLPECSRLQTLKINHVTDSSRTSNADLEHISKRCKFLKEIDIGDDAQVTDSGLMGLFKNCPELKKVKFGEKGEITRDAFFHPPIPIYVFRQPQTKCAIAALSYSVFGFYGLALYGAVYGLSWFRVQQPARPINYSSTVHYFTSLLP